MLSMQHRKAKSGSVILVGNKILAVPDKATKKMFLDQVP